VSSWFDVLRASSAHLAPVPEPARPRVVPRPASWSTRARLTGPAGGAYVGTALHVLRPAAPIADWQRLDLSSRALDTVSPAQLLELLADVSPDVSKALWDFLRFCNPGWTALAVRPSGAPAPQSAQTVLHATITTIGERHGAIDVLLGRLWIGAFLRGAFFAELVLDADSRVALDIATPDPDSARFRSVNDPLLGSIWQLGQYQHGEWMVLDSPTIRYIPIDPFPHSPYGRSLASPALFPCLFLIALLHDLKRVVQQQGYPRIDVAINLEQILKVLPPDVLDDPEAAQAFVQHVTQQVKDAYAQLQPDDAYIHTDNITVNRPVGTLDSSMLGAVDGLIRALERMATRALKSMPLLMGINEGTTETLANRQWEVHAAGIKALQHLCEGLLEHLLSLAMQAQGQPYRVQWRFAELRSAELLRDEQTAEKRHKNAAFAYSQGWFSQEQAAQYAVGQAPDADAPRRTSTLAPEPTSNTADPEPGSQR
jgi:hypothetical protein